MTTSPTHPRQITALALTIAAWLTLTPGGAFSSEPIQPTASMAVARRGHTATVLADGRVLIVGGLDASGPLAAAEVFDPAQKTFSLAGNLVNARYGHTATLLTNGRVLIAGGQDASGAVASAEIFDPADTNGFRLLPATMGAARAGHTATVRSDGTVLLAGGDTAGTAEIFDPATESFYTPLLPMASPRSGHTATPLADDNLFLVGGGTASIELFNAASNSFSLWPNGLSQIRSGHSSIPTTDGKLLVIGGDPSGTFETFDPTAGSSLLSLSLGTPSTTANLLANNQILVLGPGVSGLFDETTTQLSPLVDTNASLLQLSGHTATELPTANKQILVAGGIDTSNNLLSSATLYNPAQISTDAGDYPPFSWVNIYGQGFLPNETVTNQVEETVGPDAGTAYAPWGVTADTNGAFATLWQIFSDEFTNTTLQVTSVGQTSGLKAQTTFTDAGATLTSVTVGSQTGTATYGTASGPTFTVTLNRSSSGNGQTATLALNGSLPTGATASFSPSTPSFNGNNSTTTSQLSINTAANTPAGTYTFTVTATGANPPITSLNFTLTVGQKTLTANVGVGNKPYDGTASATISSRSLTGIVGSDDVNLGTSGTATFNNKNAGTAKPVTVAGLALSGTTAPNYQLASSTVSTTANISALAITVAAVTATKTYDGTTSAAGTPTITPALVGGDSTTALSQAFQNKNAGAGNKVIIPSITINDGNGGANYAVTLQNFTTGTINKLAITVTAATNTKTYDATTSATATPTISPALATGDTSGFTETYDTKHAGTGKTLTPSGTVNDGNGGNNYTVTFANNTTGVINTRAITVTAATNTKSYDGTTSAAATPTVTSGVIQTGDTANFTETYDTKNVGTGKTLTAAGTVTDGNGGANYAVSFVNNTTGVINARALTVTAATNTKTYDGTTSAAAVPTVTSGAIQTGDTANFSEAYTSKNAGTGKTLTPTGTVTDGNSGNNYSYTFVNNTSGIITARPLTVTAATNTKTYDGNTSATATPTITSGTLQGTDTANFTEVYNSKNAGTGKTLTPSGTVTDGNSGNNYSYTFVPDTTGVITTRAIIVTAATNTKTYDGTTSAAGTPTVTSGAIQTGDTANFTETYDTKNVGTGKTLTPAGTVTDGNGGANYAVSFVNNTTGVINARALTVSAVTNTKTYDASASAAATPTVTSGAVQTGDTANFIETYDNKNAGTAKTLTPSGTVSDGNGGGNYTYNFIPVATGVINQRALTVTAQANTKVYDSTTSATASPVITVASLQGSDTANFIEIYNNQNVGTGKTLTASGTVNDGNSGNNYSYSFVNNTAGIITARPLTVTAATNTKTYDGNTSATATPTITSGALQGTDTANFTEVYNSKNAGTGKTLTPSGTVNDGNGGNNYSYTFVNDTTGAITARALTVTATGVNKVYDGGITATVTLSDDRISGDVFTVSYASATFADKNVGPGKAISVTGISISGTDSGNYTFNTTASTSANITAKALTVSATGTDKVYDGTTTATVTLNDNRVSGDVFSDGYTSANFSDKDADTGKTVTVTGISISGTDAGNYTFNTTAVITADITPRVLTVTAHGINKIYDGTTTATFTLTDDRVAGDNVVENVNSANFFDRNVGPGKTVTVILSSSIGGQDHKDYVLASTTLTTAADITSRALTVTAVTNTKIYDGNTSAAAIPTANAIQDADIANFTEAYTDRNVGTGKTLKASGTVTDSLTHVASLNYTISFVDNTAGVINARTLTITATTNAKGYDGNTSAAAPPTTSGLQGTDTVTGLVETYDTKEVGTGKTLTVSAGYTVNDGFSGGNYSVTLIPNTTGVITAAALTLKPKGSLTTYDGSTLDNAAYSDNTDNYDISGFMNGENVASAGITLSGSMAFNASTATVVKDAATYSLAAGSLSLSSSDNNYSLSFDNSAAHSYVIQQATLSASIIGNPTKPYDGNVTATLTPANFSLMGLIGTESFTVTKTAGSHNSKDVLTANTVTASLVAADFTPAAGTLAANYVLPTSASGAGHITAAPVMASIIGNPTKPYDGNTGAMLISANFSLSGLASGESFTVTKTLGSYNSKDVATAATLSTSLAASDFAAGASTSASNYQLPTSASGPGHITPLTVGASIIGNPTKPYNGNDLATLTPANFSLSGLISGESFSVTQTAGTYDSKDVVTATTVTASLSAGQFSPAAGTLAGNYVLPTTASGAGTITAVTVSASIIGDPTKPYDGNTSAVLNAASFQLTGLIGPESFTVTQIAGTYNSKDVLAATTVTASLSMGDFSPAAGTLASNYVLPSTASGPGHITAVMVSASIIGDPTKHYDGNTSATLTPANFQLTGLISGESFTVTQTAGTYNSKDVLTASTVTASLAAGDFTPGADTFASNYGLPTTATGAGHITAAALTFKPKGSLTTYDGSTLDNAAYSDNTDNYDISGFMNGENVASAGITLSGSMAFNASTATVVKDAATYSLAAGSLSLSSSDNNYSLSFDNSAAHSYVIQQATLSASIIGNPTKPYDGNVTATLTPANFSLMGLIGTESFTVTKTAGSHNSKDVLTANTVTASLVAADFTPAAGTLAANYVLPTSASGAGHITAAPVMASIIGNPTKPYDGNTGAMLISANFSLSGLASGESFTVTKTLGSYNSKDVVTANTVSTSLTGTDFTAGAGTSASNYNLPTSASGPGHLTAVTVTASIIGDPTKPYDGNTSATLIPANFSLSGLISGESFTVTQTAGTYNSKDVVSANTVNTTLAAGDFSPGPGTLASNYGLPTTVSGAGHITAVTTLTASIIGNPAKVYNATTAATLTPANFSLSGLIGSESFTVTKTSGTYNSPDVATATTVTVSLTATDFTPVGGTLASNYGLPTSASGAGHITPAQTSSVLTPPTTIVFGHQITLSDSISVVVPGGGTPTGTVTFKDGATILGPGSLSGSGPATATYSTASLSVGSHTITAVYAGDTAGNFVGSTAVGVTVTVIPSVNITFLPPLAGQPVGNKIKVGQVVPHKVDLVNSLGQSVTSGVSVKLKVLGIDTSLASGIFQDVIEDANGVGNDGTVTSDGTMAYTGGHWQFNLDTSNFSDPNTYSESSKSYTSTVNVIDNATLLTVGSMTITLETGK